MNEKEQLEMQLGQLAYQIGKKQQEGQELNKELQNLQIKANETATQLGKLYGK